MKNLILSCTFACAAALTGINQSFAQSTKANWGVKAGLDVTTLGSFNDAIFGHQEYIYRPGFQVGIIGIVPISGKFNFMPQVLYAQKGANANESYLNTDIIETARFKICLSYIDVPFLIGFKPRPDVTFTLGPQLSFLVSQKTTVSRNYSEDTSAGPFGYRKISYGANLGAAVAFTPRVIIGLNYMYDFQHIYDPGLADGGYQLHKPERNSGFALTASYLF